MTSNESTSLSKQEVNMQTILLVEDEEAVGEVLEQAVKEETPHKLIEVTNATQALEVVTSIKPGLFILDYHLPGIDGLELSDRLHAIEEFSSVPTLLISANLPSHNELQSRHITFLQKPFDLADFLTTLERLLAEQQR
jgi:CheY-like chemotaxis protein